MLPGHWDGKYFDTFIHRSDYESESLDRDKWIGWVPPNIATVSTMPLRMSCEEVFEVIRNVKIAPPPSLWQNLTNYNHHVTRTFRQSGGFIRPRFFWEAEIPSTFNLVWPHKLMANSCFEGMPEFDSAAPRVTPSTAIKTNLTGIENVRLRSDCEAFYFKHGDTPVSGLYRRKLWPEPSEDPVYGLIWNQAILTTLVGSEELIAAIDDIDEGILDRGYRVSGEKQTMNSRELDDLFRGQLEDAKEAVAGTSPTSHDWVYMCTGLIEAGDARSGVRASINAVRLNPTDVAAGIALACALSHINKYSWSIAVFKKLEVLSPDNPSLLYNLAIIESASGDFTSAFTRLKKALRLFDQAEVDIPRYWILAELQFVAEKLGASDIASSARTALETYSRSGGVVESKVVLD